MGDFSTGFGTGFQIGAIIKEKKIAKKATEDLQAALQEWQLSGKEPSYVDKLMMGLLATKVGENYSRIFGDITNNKDSYNKEAMSQSAINLREYNAQVLNFVKMIQTSAKEGTLDLIPWDSVQALMPDVDLTKVLNSIPELKNKQYEAKTKEQNIDIYGKTPTEYKMGVGEQLGVIPEGVQPTTTPKEPTPLSAKDNWAIENYNSGKISFNQLSKYMGTLIEPEKATALEEKIKIAKQYGADNEEIKNMIVGDGAEGTDPETVSTLKSWETMFNIKDEGGPKTEEEYNRALDLLAQSRDKYKPKYANWKEALIAEVRGIGEELKGYAQDKSTVRDKEGMTPQDYYKFLLKIYMRKLEEIKAKYPDVDLSQFPDFSKQQSFWQKLLERGKYSK